MSGCNVRANDPTTSTLAKKGVSHNSRPSPVPLVRLGFQRAWLHHPFWKSHPYQQLGGGVRTTGNALARMGTRPGGLENRRTAHARVLEGARPDHQCLLSLARGSDTIDYLAACFEIIGVLLIGRLYRQGFLVCLLCNALWILVALQTKVYGLILVSCFMAVINVYNWHYWRVSGVVHKSLR
jgi:hypothetical protein